MMNYQVDSAGMPVYISKVTEGTDKEKKEDKKFRFKSMSRENVDGNSSKSTDPLDSDDNIVDAETKEALETSTSSTDNGRFVQKTVEHREKQINNPLVEGNDMTPDQLEKFKTKDMEGDVAEEAMVDVDASANPEAHSSMPEDLGAQGSHANEDRFRFRQIT